MMIGRPVRSLLVGVAFLVSAVGARADHPLVAPTEPFRLDLASHASVLEDESGLTTLLNVQNQSAWRAVRGRSINFGLGKSVLWFRVELENRLAESRGFFLEVGNPVLDHVDMSVIRSDGLPAEIYVSGDRLPFASRPLPTRSFVFPFEIPASDSVTLYLRVESAGGRLVPLTLSDAQGHWLGQQETARWDGAYLGLLLVMLFYNLVLMFYTRERGYAYYVIHIAVFTVTQMCHLGYAYQIFWPDSPRLNQFALLGITWMVAVTALSFTTELMHMRDRALRLWRGMRVSIVLTIATCLIGLFVIPYSMAVKALSINVALAAVIIVAASFHFAYRGDRIAKYYLIAWTPLLASYVNYALSIQNLSPLPVDALSLLKFAVAMEAVLFSLVLAARIQEERAGRLSAQARLSELESRGRDELEHEVHVRTRELQEALKRLDKLSTTDSLTNVYNRRFFERQFEYEWQRCQREHALLSVILVDVDHFKDINDKHGHSVGDYVLQEVAELIRGCVLRSVDSVCRFGGDEFVLVLPGTSHKGAVRVAEKIRSQVEVARLDVDDVNLTTSAGVATLLPKPELSPKSLIDATDDALYQAKREGRNRVISRPPPAQDWALQAVVE